MSASRVGWWVVVVLLGACAPSVPPVAAPTCAADETACGTNCAKLKEDDLNCGSCGRACGDGRACANGACYPTSCGSTACDPSSVCFADVCTDKSCVGVLCPTGFQCARGQCVCASGRLSCGGACADPSSDDANCGTCGVACRATERCTQGACLPQDCPAADCDPLSVCFRGTCTERACVGVVCPAGTTCTNGACGCAPGSTLCGSACADPRLDDANCGTCGTRCGASDRCAQGACLPRNCPSATCDPLSVCYQGTCTEAACIGVACAGGTVCRAGACVCPLGQVVCGGQCVTTATDAQHCGGCGRACATGQSCVDSQCAAAACTAGQTLCGGACVDTRIDPQHCGACGVACGAGRNCVAGQCTCPPGRTDCTAACVALATDPSNCGACGRSCGAGTCTNGACTCPSSQQLCAGSCVPTASDAANCGSCGRACAMGQVCSNGTCTCPAGQTLCQGQCLPTASDNLNCGGCGTVCPSGRFCSAGQCVLPFTCQTNFNMPPMDCGQLPIDLMRCGVSTLASTAGPFTGMLVTNTDVFTYALSPQPAERYRITASLLGTSGSSSSYRLSLLNDAGTELVGRSSVATNSSVEVETIDVSGSLGDCLQPAAVRLNRTFNNISYTVNVERYTTNGRNNLGSTSLTAPTPLLTNPAGRTCDQVCGTLSTSCGGVRQHFAVVIPPRKAAIFEYAMRGGSPSGTIYFLTAYQPSGVVICDLVRNQLISTMWEVATARLVNNTSSPQTVIVQPNITSGSGLTNLFQLSVAVEP